MNEEPRLEEIAIVGMSGRFPGAAGVEEFWENLRNGVESIVQFTEAELRTAGIDAETLTSADYVRARGALDGVDMFDAEFFNMLPREAANMDPQHRLMLEHAWAALENAGCDPERFPGAIGVFAGAAQNSYLLSNLCHDRAFIQDFLSFRRPGQFQISLGNDKDFLTSRIAYKLDLKGPGVTIQTACSTSLVAVCQACQSLLTYQCDMALAGGVALSFPLTRGYHYEEGGMVSPDGHCRAFDAQAQGTVFGNGLGLVVLKRLHEAVAAGDTIYAVIKGAALNNDGTNKVSYTAPSVEGQARVIALAHELAGVSADTVTCVEAHGTGTALGDPIEVAALTKAFRATTDRAGFCAIGSVKTNIGHLDAAAGVAGLIKTVMALHHREIPATLHFSAPNPAIDFDASPFFVNTAHRAWDSPDGPRRAGVSSFGVGGTNAHVVLEEAPALARPTADERPQVLLLSAKTAGALDRMEGALVKHLARHPEADLADVAHTLQTGRRVFAHRRAIVASPALGKPMSRVEERRARPVTFLFPGQGAQSTGMGKCLYRSEPVFRAACDECAELARPILGFDLREVTGAEINETRVSQPALFALEYALARLWMAWGVSPALLAGHSVGEYVAATLAGVFTLPAAMGLVAQRALLVQALPPGAMLAVRAGEAELRENLPAALAIAAVNSPKLCVVAGPEPAIAMWEGELAARKLASVRLASGHAFHSPMVEAAVEPFRALVAAAAPQAPAIPVVSCVTGQLLTAAEACDPGYWAGHLRSTVRFADALGTVFAQGDTVLVEIGPGQTLATLARQHPAHAPSTAVVASLPAHEDESGVLAAALGGLWLAGVEIDWTAYRGGVARRKVPLPTYAFERKRHWVEPPAHEAAAAVPEIAVVPPVTHVPVAVEAAKEPLFAPLQTMLEELSGMKLEAASMDATFLDLGFDSLLLTQFRQALQHRFGVRVTSRQLFEDLATPRALALHLEAASPQPPAALPSPVIEPTLSPVPVPSQAHGPFQPVRPSGEDASLTDVQRAHLHDLCTRMSSRSAKSKAFAQQYRRKLADPRSVAGFRTLWKELTFQTVMDRSEGSHVWDVDGQEYVDITMGFGANLLGHSPPYILEAVQQQLAKGYHIGPQSALAGEAADLICELTGVERVTFCNTGSEAVMAAMRVARAVTGRDRIVYFNGDYHGNFDEVLLRPGAARSLPVAVGIPAALGENVIVLEYGSAEALEVLRARAGELAGVLVEPVQSRHPEVLSVEFLRELRAITAKAGAMLIFDEVITGFRVHPGGCQALFGIEADLVTYGKIVGGGFPIGVLAGKAAALDAIDGGWWQFGDDSVPEADMTFFAGTFVRHPLALAAAGAVLRELKRAGAALQAGLNERAACMIEENNRALAQAGMPLKLTGFSSLFRFEPEPEFTGFPIVCFHLREAGIYIREPRQNCFLSTVHTAADIEKFSTALQHSLAEVERGGWVRPKSASAPLQPVPLTHGQQEIWLACQMHPAATRAYNESAWMRLRGAAEPGKLRRAWGEVLQRHEALRATFDRQGKTQRFDAVLNTDFASDDWSALDSAARERATHAALAAETSTAFDLERGPLMRLRLVKLAADEWMVIFTAHHLVCDGWSAGVILEEFCECYTGGAVLAAAPSYGEYAKAAAGLENGPAVKEAEAWWTRQFATVPPPLDLPGDTARPAVRTYAGGREEMHLAGDLTQRLRGAASQRGCTLHAVLFAAFNALLGRLSAQNDLVVGIAVAGQSEGELGGLVGHCVNLLPVRSRLDPRERFSALLARTRGVLLDAQEHGTVTFGRLLQLIPVPRHANRVPLVSVIFNLDPTIGTLRIPGLELRTGHAPRAGYQFDLGFNIVVEADGLRVECDYSAELFAPATVRSFLDKYAALLELLGSGADPVLDELLLPRGVAVTVPVAHFATATEARLAEVWKATLGHDRFTRIDGFFDVGGHSLRAMEMVQRASESLGLLIPISQLYSTSTIETLAAWLDAPPLEDAPPALSPQELRSLAIVQAGGPEGVPIVFVAGMEGVPCVDEVYRMLAWEIGPGRPFYVLRPRGWDGRSEPHRGRQIMAIDFLVELRKVRARGPYTLAGYGAGGLIAQEMAAMLSPGEREQSSVVMINTRRPASFPGVGVVQGLADRASQHLRRLPEIHLGPAEITPPQRALYEEFARLVEAASTLTVPDQVTLLMDGETHSQNASLGWAAVKHPQVRTRVVAGSPTRWLNGDSAHLAAALREQGQVPEPSRR